MAKRLRKVRDRVVELIDIATGNVVVTLKGKYNIKLEVPTRIILYHYDGSRPNDTWILSQNEVTETQVENNAPVAVPDPSDLTALALFLEANFFFIIDIEANTSGGTGLLATSANQTNGLQKTQITDGTKEASITEIQAGQPATAAVATFKVQIASTTGSQVNLNDGTSYDIFGGTDWVPTGTIAGDAVAIANAMNLKFTGWTAVPSGDTIVLTRNVVGQVIFTLTGNASPTNWSLSQIVSYGQDFVAAKNGLDTNIIGDEIGFNLEATQLSILNTLAAILATKQNAKTYSAAITATSVAALATDIFEIRNPLGSGKVIYIKHISVTAIATSASNVNLLVIKRNALNTGGISVSVGIVALDSTNPASIAQVLSYNTTNPTLGAAAGTVHTKKIYIGSNLVGGGSPPNADLWELGDTSDNTQPITLQPGQSVALNLNATTIAGNNFNIDALWIEV